MTRFGLRVGAWTVAGAVAAMLAAACGAASHATSPGTGSGRQISTMRLIKDDRALDRGVLTYSKLTTLQVQQTTSFDVKVTDVGRGPERSAFARESRGRFVAPQDVPTGGIVSVQSICSGGLACTPLSSSTRQAIARPGQSATWRWQVAARSPGQARILIIATTYGRRSKIVLNETSVMAGVNVQSTPLYVLETGFDSRKGTIVVLASGMLVVAGALGGVLALLRKQRRGSAAARTPTRADPSAAHTEPLRAVIGRPLPMGLPQARPTLGWKALLWLLAPDIAIGGLVIWFSSVSVNSLGLKLARTASTSCSSVSTPNSALYPLGPIAVAVTLPLYFLPVIIAYLRSAPDRASVAIITVLLGWTYVGWVAALALAVRDRRPAIVVVPEPGNAHSTYATKRNSVPRGESDVSPAGRAALLQRGSR